MRTRMISAAAVAATALALVAAPAFAQGGAPGGGGGGGGGAPAPAPAPSPAPVPAPTASGGAPCVSIDRFAAGADQSATTTAAAGSADFSLSRCGSSPSRSFTITLTATDPTGAIGWTSTDSWTPSRSLPFATSHRSDNLAFNTTYQLLLAVTDSGAPVVSQTLSVSTPATRVAACASVLSMNATGGYAPGAGTIGAIWAGYKVQNCGGTDQLDMELVETDHATGIVAWRSPNPSTLAAGGTGGVGLVDNDYAPLSTTYDVVVNVREHSTGDLLDTRSMVASTPPPK